MSHSYTAEASKIRNSWFARKSVLFQVILELILALAVNWAVHRYLLHDWPLMGLAASGVVYAVLAGINKFQEEGYPLEAALYKKLFRSFLISSAILLLGGALAYADAI